MKTAHVFYGILAFFAVVLFALGGSDNRPIFSTARRKRATDKNNKHRLQSLLLDRRRKTVPVVIRR